MSRAAFALSMLVVLAVAGWAYHVNYRTGEMLERVRALEAEIARERARLDVLRVEWAHLNRPARLRRLVAEHNDRLALMPLSAEHFATAAEAPGGRP